MKNNGNERRFSVPVGDFHLDRSDIWEFVKAMDALKRRLRRQPTPREILHEAKRLGYQR